IKGAERKSGGCARKAVELTSGGLHRVSTSGLGVLQGTLTAMQKSAEGIVGRGFPAEGPNAARAGSAADGTGDCGRSGRTSGR
ncbi:MAG: hypothetical protein ACREMA_16220, partial [Longimicrobiales bacterium]